MNPARPLILSLVLVWLAAMAVLAMRVARAEDAGPASAVVAPVTSDIAVTTTAPPDTATTVTVTHGPPADAGGFASDLLGAYKAGKWRLVVAAALGLLMLALARVRNMPRSPFRGDRGGALLLLLLSALGSLVVVLYSDATLSVTLVLGTLLSAATAAGGFNLVKKIFWPADKAA